MPRRVSKKTGSELFIVDNSETDWKVARYLHDWCQLSKSIDVATGYFEIGSLLALKDEWQKVDSIRVLMGDEVGLRTKKAFEAALSDLERKLDDSLEREKETNDFLHGVPAIVDAIRSGKITCRVYRKDKFHAKAYITHARQEVLGSFALVGSSNFTYPGLNENVELNVQVTGQPVSVLQEWYDEHWKLAEDATPEILRTIERHTREYSPFEVYAKSLYEFFRGHELTATEWERKDSRMYDILDQYQREGYHALMKIARRHRGAFLCDGVGLGKTFIGLMLIERLIAYDRKRVALFVPKGAREPVWEKELNRYLPHLSGDFSNLVIFNHTDLLRKTAKIPERLEKVQELADVIIIDEAHHFRNRGVKGEPDEPRKSRYWQLFDIVDDKQMFMLTATPINNRLTDLQHMIELFSREEAGYFKDAPLGIHSLPGHFRKVEKALERHLGEKGISIDEVEVSQAEAEEVLSNDALYRALVVQRSRSYVKKSQVQHGTELTMFPNRKDPVVVNYSIEKTYGKLLKKITKAFDKKYPLFALAMYYPLAYYKGPEEGKEAWEEGRQRQVVSLIRTRYLKLFESSPIAFEISCHNLLKKLLAWVQRHSVSEREKKRYDKWRRIHDDLAPYIRERQCELWGEEISEEDEEEDVVTPEMLEAVEKLDTSEFRVDDMLDDTYQDLELLMDFIRDLQDLSPEDDDKLRSLIDLLREDPILKRHKVLIFTEYVATARRMQQQLEAAGFEAVDEVDSKVKRDRGDIITRFAPYYNGSSSGELESRGETETRILISTDVLSEGLNLQDASCIINYDLHWNPVRLMQRIGRVDRRMNPDTEQRILADHPNRVETRSTVWFWNFLPPNELDELLRLYQVVAKKTLRISKVFGIEGKKLLTAEDDYEALKDFSDAYEGTTTALEDMHLEYEGLLQANPALLGLLESLPQRVFSGKQHPTADALAVFFCFNLPGIDASETDESEASGPEWTEDAGFTRWYMCDVESGRITEEANEMIELIRSAPDTPRHRAMQDESLSEMRAEVEKHIKNTYLKQVQAPIGVKPTLKCWMELS